MDDHVYMYVLEYAELDLIPRFKEEYKPVAGLQSVRAMRRCRIFVPPSMP